MGVILRKFAGQLVFICLLFGTLIPADASAQTAPTRESTIASIRSQLEKGKHPPQEIEQRLAAAGQIWDAAQTKGLDSKTAEELTIQVAQLSLFASLDRITSAAKKVLDREEIQALNNTSLAPDDKGVILYGLANSERIGISPDRQKEIFDTMVKMEPRINEARNAQGRGVAVVMLEAVSNGMQAGLNPEKATERAENISKIAENLKAQGLDEVAVHHGSNAANAAFIKGIEFDGALKFAERIGKMKQDGVPNAEVTVAAPAMLDAIKSGASEEKIEEAIQNARTTGMNLLEKAESTTAARIGAKTTSTSSIDGKETDNAKADGEQAGGIALDIEKKIGVAGAAAAESTIVKGTSENQANTEEAARAAAERGQKASDEGKGTAVGNAGANGVGQAMLLGKTRADADKIAETLETAADKSLAAGQGTDAVEVGNQAAFDVLVKAGGTPEEESTETKTEEKEEEETPTQPAQTEEKEETPTQPTQPTANE